MRAGTRLHEGIEIPEFAKVCKSKSGQDFYVSAIVNDSGIYKAVVKYIKSGTFKNVSYNIIEKYL